MAKNIHMVDPFEVLTGNLGSKQDLRYRENNNKAYEAPNGVAAAKNYRTRYVGVKKADGTVYFMVKKKSTANLNNKTRMAMAILGSIAAIKSAEKTGHAADWRKLQQIYAYRKDHGWDEAGENISFNKWLDYWLRKMLQYKSNDISLSASAGLSVTLKNPYLTYDEGPTLAISTSIFTKFAGMLYTGDGVEFTIDGVKFIGADGDQWNTFKRDATNQNIVAQWTSIDAPDADDAPVKYNLSQIYTSAGVAVKTDDLPIANEKYTTIAPSA